MRVTDLALRVANRIAVGQKREKIAYSRRFIVDDDESNTCFLVRSLGQSTSNKLYTYMNKAELVAEVQKSLGADTSKASAERSVQAVLEGIKKGIKKDKNVQLIGFGTYSVTKRAARDGINPQTGDKIRIKASKAIKFKAGAGFKAVLQSLPQDKSFQKPAAQAAGFFVDQIRTGQA